MDEAAVITALKQYSNIERKIQSIFSKFDVPNARIEHIAWFVDEHWEYWLDVDYVDDILAYKKTAKFPMKWVFQEFPFEQMEAKDFMVMEREIPNQ